MNTEPRRLTNPNDLKAVAHPLRMAILETLTLHGPMTATELGERLGENPSNCSWHLRKLAQHGFVAEAGGGTGRQRPWRAAHIGMRWDDGGAPDDDADLSVAGLALTQLLLDREQARLVAAIQQRPDDDPAWRDASTIAQSMAWLTADELAEINEAVTELILSHRERLEQPGLRPAGSRLCALMAWGVPNPSPAPTSQQPATIATRRDRA